MMFRNIVLGFFLLCLAGTAILAIEDPHAWPATFAMALICAALAFERARYHDKVRSMPGAPLHPTGERFVDPESGRRVQVWTNAHGDRHYLEEEGPVEGAV